MSPSLSTPAVHYCTYFDEHYATRALALYRSLVRHSPPFVLWVLALSLEAQRIIAALGLPNIRMTTLEELEAADPDLLAIKPTRTRIEYYHTLTPCWPRYLFATVPDLDHVTYLDADLWLFASPQPLFDEAAPHSIAITAHRFDRRDPHLAARYGRFNVAWISFRRDAQALACLDDWRRRCLEWCHERIEDGKFGDQKYLDAWPEAFAAHVLTHEGANVAPWNIRTAVFSERGGRILVNGSPLLFFHFSGVQQAFSWLYLPNLRGYEVPMSPLLRRLYRAYLKELRDVTKEVERVLGRSGSWRQFGDVRIGSRFRRWKIAVNFLRAMRHGDILALGRD